MFLWWRKGETSFREGKGGGTLEFQLQRVNFVTNRGIVLTGLQTVYRMCESFVREYVNVLSANMRALSLTLHKKSDTVFWGKAGRVMDRKGFSGRVNSPVVDRPNIIRTGQKRTTPSATFIAESNATINEKFPRGLEAAHANPKSPSVIRMRASMVPTFFGTLNHSFHFVQLRLVFVHLFSLCNRFFSL